MISIIIPCYNESEALPHLTFALARLASRLPHSVEFVLVDDGSQDRTWEQMQAFAGEDSRVVAIRLSRNFGHQFALTAGYDFAKGDAIVCLDADLQDPPEVVEEMVRKWEQGFDVVYGVREKRESETWFKLWTAKLFYRLMGLLGVTQVKEEVGDFRLMSRRALEALNQMRERHRLVRGMVGWVGFNEAEVRYIRQPRRAGETKYPFRRMLALAVDGVLSFSFFPLRIAYLSAFAIVAVVFGYVSYSALQVALWGGQVVPGWTSLLLAVCIFGGANLVCLGLMGEYIGRIFEEVKERPLYLVREISRNESRV